MKNFVYAVEIRQPDGVFRVESMEDVYETRDDAKDAAAHIRRACGDAGTGSAIRVTRFVATRENK